MVYIFGFFGFVMGFAVGLGIINVLLRHYSKEELKEKKSLHRIYGLLVWILAAFGGWLGTFIYNHYFY